MEEFLELKKGETVVEKAIFKKINVSYVDFDFSEAKKMKATYPLIQEWKCKSLRLCTSVFNGRVWWKSFCHQGYFPHLVPKPENHQPQQE